MRYLLLLALAACSKPAPVSTTATIIVDDAVVDQAEAISPADAPSPATP